ncbi:MAG: hypothetical protein M1832_001471 [Thelocarpon impressellum]|nr:MAG: hypothetical protein M1832_001471 [Thelocarpon impressellum]
MMRPVYDSAIPPPIGSRFSETGVMREVPDDSNEMFNLNKKGHEACRKCFSGCQDCTRTIAKKRRERHERRVARNKKAAEDKAGGLKPVVIKEEDADDEESVDEHEFHPPLYCACACALVPLEPRMGDADERDGSIASSSSHTARASSSPADQDSPEASRKPLGFCRRTQTVAALLDPDSPLKATKKLNLWEPGMPSPYTMIFGNVDDPAERKRQIELRTLLAAARREKRRADLAEEKLEEVKQAFGSEPLAGYAPLDDFTMIPQSAFAFRTRAAKAEAVVKGIAEVLDLVHGESPLGYPPRKRLKGGEWVEDEHLSIKIEHAIKTERAAEKERAVKKGSDDELAM